RDPCFLPSITFSEQGIGICSDQALATAGCSDHLPGDGKFSQCANKGPEMIREAVAENTGGVAVAEDLEFPDKIVVKGGLNVGCGIRDLTAGDVLQIFIGIKGRHSAAARELYL